MVVSVRPTTVKYPAAAPSPAKSGGHMPAQLVSSVVEPGASPSTPWHAELPTVSLANEYKDNPVSAVSKLPEPSIAIAPGTAVCTGNVTAGGGVGAGVGAGVGVGAGAGLLLPEPQPSMLIMLTEAATNIIIFDNFMVFLRVIICLFKHNYAGKFKKLHKVKNILNSCIPICFFTQICSVYRGLFASDIDSIYRLGYLVFFLGTILDILLVGPGGITCVQ